MIYLTGDTHGGVDFHRLHRKQWTEQESLTREDYLVILGDFGGLWTPGDREIIELLDKRKFTTLFICGNHENFDLLYKYPLEDWNGGKIRRVAHNVLHLARGQVFNINGNKIFTFGGANSVDKVYRRLGTSWWPEEIPSYKEIEEGLTNLERVSNTVDYVFTHTSPTHMAERFFVDKLPDPVSDMLDKFDEILTYKMWYFGHFHMDKRIDRFRCMYYDIRLLGS
jgi:hypothetical protein